MGSNSIPTTGLNFVPLHTQSDIQGPKGNSSPTQVATKGVSNYVQDLKSDLNNIKDMALKFTMTQSAQKTLNHQPSTRAVISQKVADTLNTIASWPGLSKLKISSVVSGSRFIQLERKQSETLQKIADFLDTKAPTEQQVKDLSNSLKSLAQEMNSYVINQDVGLPSDGPGPADATIVPLYEKLDKILMKMEAKQEVLNLPNFQVLKLQVNDPKTINTPEGIQVKEMFDQLLVETHSHENAEFQEAIIDFSKNPTAESANEVMNKFVYVKDRAVNLYEDTIRELEENIADGNITDQLFDTVYTEIRQSLTVQRGQFEKWLQQPFDLKKLLT